jgi:alkyl sulfatase BDS1-like metallo-beta-lactamase superfamily hydrolase
MRRIAGSTLGLITSLGIALMATTPAIAAGGGSVLSDPGAWEGKHFDPKGKMPSKFTIELQNGLRKSLPFDDRRDFEEAKRGFIAAPDYKQIMAEAGNVAWDMGSYEWLLEEGQDFDSMHPSLQRQAILNMA